MALPIAPKAWKEINRLRREQRKRYKEEMLSKKLKEKEIKKKLADEIIKADEKRFAKKDISTLSIAVPGSILNNAQSSELRSYLAGQIARAACVYKVNEVVVFDDKGDITEDEKKKVDKVLGGRRIACLQLARILQYLECPQYLRKYFFPIHRDLQYAGVLNSLDAPHHLRQEDVSLYREGVVTKKPNKIGRGSFVNIGLLKDISVDKVLAAGLRVTVRLPKDQPKKQKLKGFIVPPTVPTSDMGLYWGYTVRLANNLTEVLTQGPYEDGYDLTIGTSDKGNSIDDVRPNSIEYHHALVIFGGLSGLEEALDNDPNLFVDDISLVFHHYWNTCPEQGSKIIRTEEAILITLAELRTKLFPKVPALSNVSV